MYDMHKQSKGQCKEGMEAHNQNEVAESLGKAGGGRLPPSTLFMGPEISKEKLLNIGNFSSAMISGGISSILRWGEEEK